jgi:hypothetical protein
MAAFDDGSDAAEGFDAVGLGADASQQSLLTTPPHA